MVEADGYGGPIGLGFRVPMLVVSPWSQGGWVDSGTYDHTSTLRFLEARWGVPIPNLTAWRRQAVGDLTSTLGFGQPITSIPALPATSLANLGNACPTPTNIGAFFSSPITVTVPDSGNQHLPQQEPGTARRR
jgi:phospholipase C